MSEVQMVGPFSANSPSLKINIESSLLLQNPVVWGAGSTELGQGRWNQPKECQWKASICKLGGLRAVILASHTKPVKVLRRMAPA